MFDIFYTLASANINQSAPNMVTVYMTIRSWMSSIMDIIGPEHLELFALELGKIAEFDFVYTLASTNINGVFSPLTSAEACEKSSRWLWKEKWCKYWCEKARKHICVTDRHYMTLAVKVALNPNTTNYKY